MSKRWLNFFCWMGGIGITLVLWLLTKRTGEYVFVIGSIIWAVYDCKRIKYWRFESGISGTPATLLIFFLIFGWPLVFPWYVGSRLKIMIGTARLREEYGPWRMSDGQIGENGLIQPWRGRKL